MRFINTTSLQLEEFLGGPLPEYAVLSHRWRAGEVLFAEMVAGTNLHKPGLVKIRRLCGTAASEGIQYAWVDTCCIDKSSSADLSEAINSMFSWYANAKTCYAYLDDVDEITNLAKSEWFTRGWTLQELLAPETVRFFNRQWQEIGDRRQLCGLISEITTIDPRVLQNAYRTVDLANYTIAQRMAWAARRTTTRPEDEAYCLMGLFGINMPLLYGEGGIKAFIRLQQEIIQLSHDQSIFAWSSKYEGHRGLLATSPECFEGCYDIVACENDFDLPALYLKEYSMTNKGLSIQLPFLPYPVSLDTHVAILNCARGCGDSATLERLAIFLEWTHLPPESYCARVRFNGEDLITVYDISQAKLLDAYVPQYGLSPLTVPRKIHGFVFKGYGYASDYSIQSYHPELSPPHCVVLSKNHFGPAGRIIFSDTKLQVKSIDLGFDQCFNPVFRLRERIGNNVEQPKETEDLSDWTDEFGSQHPGLTDIGLYAVIHERNEWVLGIPRTRHDGASQLGAKPTQDRSEVKITRWRGSTGALHVQITKPKLSLFLNRRQRENGILWEVLVNSDKFGHIGMPATDIMDDPADFQWHPVPRKLGDPDSRRAWKGVILKNAASAPG